MLQSLRVRNFRGIADLSVGPFGRLNAFTGRNESGKTSLLEAIFLNCGANDATLVMSLFNFRGETSIAPTFDRPFSSLFHAMDFGRSPEIKAFVEAGAGEGRARTLRIEAISGLMPNPTAGATHGGSGLSGVKFMYSSEKCECSGVFQWETGEDFVRQTIGRKKNVQLNPDIDPCLDRIDGYFLTPYYRDVWGQTHKFLTDAVKGKRVDQIVAALQIIEPGIQGILPLTDDGIPSIYIDVGRNYLIPASSMGSGFCHLLNIALPVVLTKHGVILIDEIEDGLHYSVLEKIFVFLSQIAAKNDLQIFFTTHSDEVISALAQLEPEDGGEVALFKLSRRDGTIHCAAMNRGDIAASREIGAELR